jgi:hypothetical protein
VVERALQEYFDRRKEKPASLFARKPAKGLT